MKLSSYTVGFTQDGDSISACVRYQPGPEGDGSQLTVAALHIIASEAAKRASLIQSIILFYMKQQGNDALAELTAEQFGTINSHLIRISWCIGSLNMAVMCLDDKSMPDRLVLAQPQVQMSVLDAIQVSEPIIAVMYLVAQQSTHLVGKHLIKIMLEGCAGLESLYSPEKKGT